MRAPLVIVVCVLTALAGCRSAQPKAGAGDAQSGILSQPYAKYPFAPNSIRIHPLTHVDGVAPDAKGKPVGGSEVVLHFELLDRFGDSVKGLGKLTVELYKPGVGMTPGIETHELSWEVTGMDDAEQNTRRFDVATRTYRVPLLAPRWVLDAVSADHGPGWVKVRVVMTVPADGGELRYLEDEYVIQG